MQHNAALNGKSSDATVNEDQPIPMNLARASQATDSAAIVVGLVALWTLTHRFLGLTLDGEIYAFQALSRLHPYLASDLYLANTSQDQFSLFSSLHAVAIERFGLMAGSRALFLLCRILYFVGAWLLVAKLADRRLAWLAVAVLICTTSPYGAYGIFESASDYLTARTLAEALVCLSIATYFSNRAAAAVLMVLAISMHPIMSLPGLLLLIFLSFPFRISLGMFAAGIGLVATLATGSAGGYLTSRFLVVMDPGWLEVVRERSQFLFLNYWKVRDWETNLRPFLTLAVTYSCLGGPNIRKVCLGAAVVGVSGLLIAGIAGSVGPVAIFLQGQAWRWMWITSLIAVLMVAPTAWKLWCSKGCGTLCAVLMVLGWTFPPIDGNLAEASALALWLLSGWVPSTSDKLLRYATYLLISIIAAWTLGSVFHPEMIDVHHASVLLRISEWLRSAFSLQCLALSLFAALVYSLTRSSTSRWSAVLVSVLLIALAMPSELIGARGSAAIMERGQLTAWRDVIPETSSVLVVPAQISPDFQWFSLGRPSYLTLSQSAGVVFSAITAAEIRRRSEVLQPVAEPDWKLTSSIEAVARGLPQPEKTRPLTVESLKQICVDPALGFVVAKESLGFEPITNIAPGRWKNWNLYDCSRVRSAEASS